MLRKKTLSGMTLIEVLIALAIVSIAVTAVIKATSQNIRATNYLQNKTMAMWVGKLVMSEAQTGVMHLPEPGDSIKKSMEMLGRNWYWQAYREPTPNKHIHKIHVQVYERESEDEDSTPIVNLEGYLYDAK